jgi:hypothetical protein
LASKKAFVTIPANATAGQRIVIVVTAMDNGSPHFPEM